MKRLAFWGVVLMTQVGCGPTVETNAEEVGVIAVGSATTLEVQVSNRGLGAEERTLVVTSSNPEVLEVELMHRCRGEMTLALRGLTPGASMLSALDDGQVIWTKAFDVTSDVNVRWFSVADVGPARRVSTADGVAVLVGGDATFEIELWTGEDKSGEVDDVVVWSGDDAVSLQRGLRLDSTGGRHRRVHVSASSPGQKTLEVHAGGVMLDAVAFDFLDADGLADLKIVSNDDTANTLLWVVAEDGEGRRVFGLDEADWTLSDEGVGRGDRVQLVEASSGDADPLVVQLGALSAERSVRADRVLDVWDSGHPPIDQDFDFDFEFDGESICCAQQDAAGTALWMVTALGLFMVRRRGGRATRPRA